MPDLQQVVFLFHWQQNNSRMFTMGNSSWGGRHTGVMGARVKWEFKMFMKHLWSPLVSSWCQVYQAMLFLITCSREGLRRRCSTFFHWQTFFCHFVSEKSVMADWQLNKSLCLFQSNPTHQDLNTKAAWAQGYTGRGVVVTILDDGIEKDHPDLISNYVSHKFQIAEMEPDMFLSQTSQHTMHFETS